MMPRSWHHRLAGGEGKRSDSLSRSLTGRRLPNAALSRACANYGCKAPTANAFQNRKGAFAGKDRRPARMGGGGENASAIVTRRAETPRGAR
jgi:hypothetical protein